jgi:hypothetical protein
MWLRDSLPHDLPGVRILIYDYDSHLVGSQSFQGMEALATEFRTHIATIRKATNVSRGMLYFWLHVNLQQKSTLRPLIFIAHSLGGLVVKEVINMFILPLKRIDNSSS